MGSDKKINYSLRPSKSIERKMFIEVLKEICTPINCTEFQYIGFGASFFTDFKLVHSTLNISKLISIEGNVSKEGKQRCQFNKPYDCIEVKHGRSDAVLPKLDWKKKSIVWLDYDKCLMDYMFDDIQTCCQKALSGGVFIISMRRSFNEVDLDEFKNIFGEKVPVDITPEDLEPINCHIKIREMLINYIDDTLLNTHSTKSEEERIVFKQLFNFTYQDDAPMYTLGGIFHRKDQEGIFNSYKFLSYPYVTGNKEPININFPIITNREYFEMTRLLPADRKKFIEDKSISFIPKEHRENYFNTYKFFPTYLEVSKM